MDASEVERMVAEHDRMLRGNGGAGILEKLRGLEQLPGRVSALEQRDVMQGVMSDAIWKLVWIAIPVAVALGVERLLT